MRGLAIRLLAALLFPAVAAAGPQASADYEVSAGGRSFAQGKLYVSGERLRTDNPTSSVIFDPKAEKMWTILFGHCEVRPFTATLRRDLFWLPNKAVKEQQVGSETIDGHPTKKFKTASSLNGETRYVWRATDLGGLAIRVFEEKRGIERVLTNVVKGRPDASLFRPPPDCRPGQPIEAPPGSTSP